MYKAMKTLAFSSTLALAIANLAHAADISVVGTIPTVVPNNQNQISHSLKHEKPNIVMLQKVKLSEHAKQAMKKRLHSLKNPTAKANFAAKQNYPSNFDLGMENVPVLNQGMHGSCVTFANAGALDALIKQGDYVSELCSLTLGLYIESKHKNEEEYPSGWNGSWGPIVLDQFFKYGVVSMQNQQSYGCGGLTDYPVWDPSATGRPMTPAEYGQLSESISDKYDWEGILSVEEAFGDGFDGDDVVTKVKDQLVRGNRVTFGVLLDINYGSNGAVGQYKTKWGKDTWMLIPGIEEDFNNDEIEAGHEMIITGYDDDAVVTSPSGVTNKGLFILRNSWGVQAGNQGEYYMTYDHFKLMTMEAQALKVKAEPQPE
jgi:hypothetical protein